MSDMVERASRAMCRLYYTKRRLDPVSPKEIDRLVDEMWESWADEARAAIEAMREPTEEMCDAGGAYLNGFDALGGHTVAYAARGTFEAMIDTALEGPAITIDMSAALSPKGE